MHLINTLKTIYKIFLLVGVENVGTKSLLLSASVVIYGLFDAIGIVAIVPLVQMTLGGGEIEQSFLPLEFLQDIDIAVLLISFALFYFIRAVVMNLIIVYQSSEIYKICGLISVGVYREILDSDIRKEIRKEEALVLSLTESNNIAAGLLIPLVGLVGEICMISFVAFALFYSGGLSLFVGGIVTFLPFLAYVFLFRPYLQKLGKQRLTLDENRNHQIISTVDGRSEINVYGVRDHFISKYAGSTKRSLNKSFLNQVIKNLPKVWFEFFAVLSILFLLWISINEGAGFDIGFFALLVAAIAKLLPAFNRCARYFQSLSFWQESAKRVSDFLSSRFSLEAYR